MSDRGYPDALVEWARGVLVVSTLQHSADRRYGGLGPLPLVEHPAIVIQLALQETFRPASPIEVYSDAQPTFIPPSPEADGQIPIDILLGCYLPSARTIKIFHKNVAHFAATAFKCSAADLELIVRLHEYAHALAHLGLFWTEELEVIHRYPAGQQTDWRSFLRDRSKAFRSLPQDAREFLAQVICWIAIGVLEPLPKRHALQELFVTVMGRQPAEYQLSPDILGKALYGDPIAVLAWARQTPRWKPPRHTPARKAAEVLLRATFP